MDNIRILVVDDEEPILDTVQAYLEQDGFAVKTAIDGLSALEIARTFRPDLVVLDIMLPGMDGLEVLRRLRKESEVYVLMLTAKADETDKIIGLTVGADDYLTKPFSPRELVARAKAILRRGRNTVESGSMLAFRRLRLDPDARKVWKDDEVVDLSPIEFDLLHALARYHGRVLSRGQLIEQVWGHDYYGDDRVVDTHIVRMRRKVEDDPSNPVMIVTVRAAGYRFEDEPI